MERVSKKNYYLDIAQTVAERSTCLRRRFGAIIVKNDSIVSTGYNGAPRGRENCCDKEFCMREKLGIPRGERYELCRSVHAEANAIIAASREEMLDSDMYISCLDGTSNDIIGGISSCAMCKRLVLNAGIRRVIFRDTKDTYHIVETHDWLVNDDSLTGKLGY